jgi:hypothetical protein
MSLESLNGKLEESELKDLSSQKKIEQMKNLITSEIDPK